jgi:hypothetical protein
LAGCAWELQAQDKTAGYRSSWLNGGMYFELS